MKVLAPAVLLAAMTQSLKPKECSTAMPQLGFGCWKLPEGAVPELILEAVKGGWRHFDSAADYGNEKQVGAGLSKAMADGLVQREELWITSKLWNTDHRPEHVEAACRRTLDDLGLEYLDLYLIHFPIALRHVPQEVRYPPGWTFTEENPKMELDLVPISATWRAMEDLVRKGLVRNIGVANFGAALLMDLMASVEIPPAMLQIELHPYNPQRRLLEFCRGLNLPVTAFSPLGSSSYISLGMDQSDAVGVLGEPAVLEVATRHNATPAQVVLAWHLARGTAAVPKTSRPDRLRENLAATELKLTAEDLAAIDALGDATSRRYNDPGVFAKTMGGDTPIFD